MEQSRIAEGWLHPNEEEGLKVVANGLSKTEQISNKYGRILILQDRFKSMLLRQLARTLDATCESSLIKQKIYANENSNDVHTYKYYRCLYKLTDRKPMYKIAVA